MLIFEIQQFRNFDYFFFEFVNNGNLMIFETVKFGNFFFNLENHNLIPKTGKFWFCSSIWYSALFVISPILILYFWNSKPHPQKFKIWKIREFPKLLFLNNLENDKIFGIFKFETLTNFQNLKILKIKFFFYFTIWKINILQFVKLLNILSIQIISKKMKK